MKENKLFEYLENIEGEQTAHLSGLKKIFLKDKETETKLTQFAYGKFGSGEFCESHSHLTMEELFYFLSGEGEYRIGEEVISIKPGTFLRIPSKTDHELRNTGDSSLEFIYFGIATE